MKDAPSWMDAMLYILNTFMETIYYALKKNITFDENISCFKKHLTFTTSASYDTTSPSTSAWEDLKFSSQLKVKPYSVVIAKISNLDYPTDLDKAPNSLSLNWEYINGEIHIYYIFGLLAGTQYSIDLLII